MRRLPSYAILLVVIGLAAVVAFFLAKSGSIPGGAVGHGSEPAELVGANVRPSIPSRVENDASAEFERVQAEWTGATEPARWQGRVVDESGAGIPEARVLAVDKRHDVPLGDVLLGLESMTDEEGRFELLPEDRERGAFRIAARKRSYYTRWEAIDERNTTIVLRPGANLVGRVLDDATGLPIAGTRVRCMKVDWPTAILPESVTDVDGAFRLDGLPAKRDAPVRIEPPDVLPIERRVRAEHVGDNVVDFRIERGELLKGVVLEIGTRRPVAGAEILVNDELSLRSDAQGHFELRCRQEYLHFEARHAEYTGSQAQAMGGASRVGIPVTLLMIPQCSLTGVARDGEGNPIIGARLILNRGRMLASERAMARAMPFDVPQGLRLGQTGPLSAMTDDSGRYEIESLLPFVTYDRLTCISDDRRLSYQPIVFAAPGEKKVLDVSFSASFGTISGSVHVDGEPSTGSVTWSVGRWHALSDIRDGQYCLVGVPAGSVELTIRTHPVALRRQEVVAVAHGSDLRHDFVMASDRGRMGGSVVGFDGVGVPGLRLIAKKGGESLATQTGSDGSFSFNLPASDPGSWWVQVEDWGWGNNAYPGSTDIRFVGGSREDS